MLFLICCAIFITIGFYIQSIGQSKKNSWHDVVLWMMTFVITIIFLCADEPSAASKSIFLLRADPLGLYYLMQWLFLANAAMSCIIGVAMVMTALGNAAIKLRMISLDQDNAT